LVTGLLTIAMQTSDSPATLFGFKPSVLVGKTLDGFVDTIYDMHQKEGIDTGMLLSAMITR
jgi:hypothetical protein